MEIVVGGESTEVVVVTVLVVSSPSNEAHSLRAFFNSCINLMSGSVGSHSRPDTKKLVKREKTSISENICMFRGKN